MAVCSPSARTCSLLKLPGCKRRGEPTSAKDYYRNPDRLIGLCPASLVKVFL
jgi:hypothetical protein